MNPHNNRRDLFTISLAFFLAFLGAGASQPFVVAYLQEVKNLSLAQASFAFSLVYFTFVVFQGIIRIPANSAFLTNNKTALFLIPGIFYLIHDPRFRQGYPFAGSS